jgi:hypothetical protein
VTSGLRRPPHASFAAGDTVLTGTRVVGALRPTARPPRAPPGFLRRGWRLVGRELEAGNDVARGLGQPGREEPCVGADQWHPQCDRGCRPACVINDNVWVRASAAACRSNQRS